MKQIPISVDYEQYLGSRSVQQDACDISGAGLFREKGILAVLADGIGGMQNGEEFSRIAVERMLAYFSTTAPEADICSELLKAYGAARAHALQYAGARELEGGSTVVAVLVRKNRFAYLSAGDSRIYLLRNGGLLQLNREHVLGAALDEGVALGYVPQEEAENNMYRKSLTNHLCVSPGKGLDRCLHPIAIRPGDKLVMMSDGVFGTLDEAEILRSLMLPGTDGVVELIEKVKRKNKPNQDNASVVMLAFEEIAEQQGGN